MRGGQRLVISPLQGLLPQKDGLCFETQAVGPGFVSSPLWGSNHSQRIFRPRQGRNRVLERQSRTHSAPNPRYSSALQRGEG